MANLCQANRMTLICSALVIAGCSLGNPYVVRQSGDPRGHFCKDPNQCSVAEAKRSAYELAELYRAKLSAHARMESAVGAGGIVIGSAVMALAIADAHADAYRAAGAIGATVYGLSTWYSNKPREEIYAKGLLALSCATTAVQSVDLPTSERIKLSTTVTARKAVDEVQSAAQSLLSQVNAGLGTDQERAQATAMIEQAQADVLAASVSLEAAAKLDSAASSAGNALMDSVDAIGAAVDDALRKTVPEGTLAIKIGNSLGDIAGKIVPGWDVKVAMPAQEDTKIKAQGRDPSKSISASLLVLSGKLINLQLELAPIRGVLSNFSASNITTGLDACKVLGLSALSVMPTELNFTAGTAGSASVVINNGKPPYSATTVGATAPGLELKNPLPFDRRLDVSITAATPAARHTVLVSDANGNGIALVIDVKKAATAPAAPGVNANSEKPAPAPAPKALTAESFIAALNSGPKSLLGGAYLIESFTLDGRTVRLKLKDSVKIAAADLTKVEDEIDNWSVLGQPFPAQRTALNLTLELPR